MQNKIDLLFADGTYTFALPIARIQELQKKTETGIGALFARVLKGCTRIPDGQGGFTAVLDPSAGEFAVIDIVETIRQGLIGGGEGVVNGEVVKVGPAQATQLIESYVLERPLAHSWSMAASILGAVIVGYDPPEDKKKA